MLLAGRAAEILVFGLPSSGAEADLAVATGLARAMHLRWGLTGRLAVCDVIENPDLGTRIEGSLRTAARNALTLLSGRRDILDRVARALLERRSLTQAELLQLLGSDAHACRRGGEP